MAAKNVLIVVGITAAALGHWTPFLLACVVLSLAPQLIAFREEFHYSAWLADLWAQCALSWRRCVELLSNTAKSPRIILLEFHLDEQQRRIRTTLAENIHWIIGRIVVSACLLISICLLACFVHRHLMLRSLLSFSSSL